MSKQETEEEPSIEEILTSIRQIISDDDEEAADDEAPADEPAPEAEPEAAAPEPEEEVIELTDKIDDEPEEEETAPEPEPIEVEMLDSAPPAEEAIYEPESEPEAESEPTFESQGSDDALFTNAAEDAAFDAFSELAKKTAVQHGGITVEEIVRSELRPLLKGWLDKHLPSIIERLVQEELERVAKRALDD